MVMAEAAAYAITGSMVGCLLGVPLHRLLFQSVILKIWGEAWELPVAVLAVTVFAAVLTTFAAVFSPTRKLKELPCNVKPAKSAMAVRLIKKGY